MEKINIRGLNGPAAVDSQKWLYKAMMAVMLANQQRLDDTWEDAFDEDKTFDVDLTIDGVEVPFTRLVERLHEGFDFAVRDAIHNHMPEWLTEQEARLCGTIENFARAVASESKDTRFWVVLNQRDDDVPPLNVSAPLWIAPPARTTLDDILFECSLIEFAARIRGGLNEDEIVGVYAYEKEEAAESHAKQLLKRKTENGRRD